MWCKTKPEGVICCCCVQETSPCGRNTTGCSGPPFLELGGYLRCEMGCARYRKTFVRRRVTWADGIAATLVRRRRYRERDKVAATRVRGGPTLHCSAD